MIRPVRDIIIIEKIENPGRVTQIIIPDMAKKKTDRGKVVAVGRGNYNRKLDKVIPLDIKVGAIVYWNTWAGLDIKVGDKAYLILRQKDLEAINVI